ncbi:unnamed protein product [Prorocentrum cordatum]|uniref:Uncharacterized protein n=1 Tax=Prorocentrum cordatum TaxID=2364126 RepID=A0ABN9QDZ4_9DINO|nr:unnamed protein product [Polarella glacialis]
MPSVSPTTGCVHFGLEFQGLQCAPVSTAAMLLRPEPLHKVHVREDVVGARQLQVEQAERGGVRVLPPHILPQCPQLRPVHHCLADLLEYSQKIAPDAAAQVLVRLSGILVVHQLERLAPTFVFRQRVGIIPIAPQVHACLNFTSDGVAPRAFAVVLVPEQPRGLALPAAGCNLQRSRSVSRDSKGRPRASPRPWARAPAPRQPPAPPPASPRRAPGGEGIEPPWRATG